MKNQLPLETACIWFLAFIVQNIKCICNILKNKLISLSFAFVPSPHPDKKDYDFFLHRVMISRTHFPQVSVDQPVMLLGILEDDFKHFMIKLTEVPKQLFEETGLRKLYI